MKKIVVRAFTRWICANCLCMGFAVSLIGIQSASAQGSNTISTMLQQIAALEAYIKTAEKGYQLVENGLHTIRDIKNGEFSLHQAFFASLKTVTPAVSGIPEVVEIISLETSMVSQLQNAVASYQKAGIVNSGELTHLNGIIQVVVEMGDDDLNLLKPLLKNGDFSMTDGERIRRIQAMDDQMRKRARYVQSVIAQTDLLGTNRQQLLNDQATLKSIYGIN
jgi:hypothetical protein